MTRLLLTFPLLALLLLANPATATRQQQQQQLRRRQLDETMAPSSEPSEDDYDTMGYGNSTNSTARMATSSYAPTNDTMTIAPSYDNSWEATTYNYTNTTTMYNYTNATTMMPSEDSTIEPSADATDSPVVMTDAPVTTTDAPVDEVVTQAPTGAPTPADGDKGDSDGDEGGDSKDKPDDNEDEDDADDGKDRGGDGTTATDETGHQFFIEATMKLEWFNNEAPKEMSLIQGADEFFDHTLRNSDLGLLYADGTFAMVDLDSDFQENAKQLTVNFTADVQMKDDFDGTEKTIAQALTNGVDYHVFIDQLHASNIWLGLADVKFTGTGARR